MEIIKAAAVAVIAGIACVYFSSGKHKEYAVFIALAAGIIILFFGSEYFSAAFNALIALTSSDYESTELLPLIKIIFTAYIAQFASDLCSEVGCKSIAANVELVSRFVILYLSLPYIISLFNFLNEIA